jgi:hypothetical protein
VTGAGTGGTANTKTNTGGSVNTGTPGGSGGQPVYDENGNVIAGATTDGTGTTYGAAVSKPFTLPDQTTPSTQWLLVAAALLLVAVVVAPPLLSQRLRRSGGADVSR